MFESLLWPFFITAVALFVMVVLAVVCSPKFGIKYFHALLLSLFLAGMAFIPSCSAIYLVMSFFRYGEFNYPTADRIYDYNIEIPLSATDITLHKTSSGHHARFTVAESELQPWLAEMRDKYELYWHDEPLQTIQPDMLTEEEFDREFGQFGWEYPADNYGLEAPYSPNAAGPTIWYSPLQQRAYLRAGYW